ncbi:molecular chaperone GrpE [Candidatus Magnetomoraceae bacterium gMMP-1]
MVAIKKNRKNSPNTVGSRLSSNQVKKTEAKSSVADKEKKTVKTDFDKAKADKIDSAKDIKTVKIDKGKQEKAFNKTEKKSDKLTEKNKAEDKLSELQDLLAEKEKELKESHDRLLRASAEFDNYKKRSKREMNDFRKFAYESIIKELLSVVDNLERALETPETKESDKSIIEGVDMTLKEMLKIFDKFSVKPIKSIGEPFNPAFHQAVMQEKSDEHPADTVIKEMQKGYMIHDRLLRPAMVVVSQGKITEENN